MKPNLEVVEVRLLGRGRHTSPRSGGCLMELVGATVGGPWTDRPACTSPTLAHLARTINDHTSSATRPELAALIPYLISNPGHQSAFQSDLAAGTSVLAAAHAAAPPDLLTALEQQLEQTAADAALSLRRLPRLTPAWHRHQLLAIMNLALRAICDATDPSRRDTVLKGMLLAAINAQRRQQALPTVSPPTSSPDTTTLTVVKRWVMPPGADWHELDVRLDPEHSPTWLTNPWLHRQAELDLHP